MNKYKEIWEKIISYNSFVILPHVKSDGDAIGSSIALKLILESINKKAYIYLKDKIPYNISSFLKSEDISKNKKFDVEAVIALDSGDISRLRDRIDDFNGVDFNIDHHISNDNYGKHNLVLPEKSSTGEIIFNIIKNNNIRISKRVAEFLFIALATDTGRFMYSNVSSDSFVMASELLKVGIDSSYILNKIYSEKPIEKAKLESHVIENCEILSDGKLAVFALTREIQDRFCCYDTEDIAEKLRDLRGVIVSALLYEYNSQVKLSLRSKDDTVDVSTIAIKFGGGGHKQASGATISEDNINEVYKKVKLELEKVLK